MERPGPCAGALPSLLYRRAGLDRSGNGRPPPEFFRDLNLDQIVAAVIAGRDQYDLEGFFYRPLDDPDDIAYRQEVMRELEDPYLAGEVAAFAAKFDEMRRCRRAGEEAYYRLPRQGSFLEAVAAYCSAVTALLAALTNAGLQSRGFLRLREYLSDYAHSAGFQTLSAETEQLGAELRGVRYCLLIRGLSVTVRNYTDEADYGCEIEATFAKFRQGEVEDRRHRFPEYSGVGHVDAEILEGVARLNPEVFARLREFVETHQNFVDPVVAGFDREVQFCLAYLKGAGLPFCYPLVTAATMAEYGDGIFDLALAAKLTRENRSVVLNDFHLDGDERVLVVSGPNQGGKTTFARTIGQLHYLARLACPVPGRQAQIFLCDRLLTHFARTEDAATLRGKLHDDLLRIRRILDEATPQSLIIMNEIFSSTALEDAVFLTTSVMRMILDLGCLALCVTFLEEAAALSDAVVSMVSTIDPADPAVRTFKLIRRPADGKAYAVAIAEKWRLTYRQLKDRLAS
jgi:hypothetical protein